MTDIRELKQPTMDLSDPEYGRATFVGRQEETIREWASEHGYKDLRGFHMELRSRNWTYYDVIQDAYK